jgi:GntR family transcriptional regulator
VRIHISTTDGVPIYMQIVNQIKYQVTSGKLPPGAELPPIRALAETLVVNPNTVARAYRELQQGGFLENRRTAGTFVSDQGSPLALREKRKILSERIDQLLAEAHQMNFSHEEIQQLLKDRYDLFQSSQPAR